MARRLFTSLASLALAAGCSLDPAAAREELDAPGVFAALVLPQLSTTCGPCHGSKEPFLEAGREYEAITKYKGGLFLTQPPELSYLLHRGQHQGPALHSDQALDVLAWLRKEGQKKAARVPVTPTVTVSPGDFFLSLKLLIDDPLARVTFKIEPLPKSPGDLLLSDLQVTAGKETGIQLKHPLFLISSGEGVVADPADSLSNVEVTVNPGASRALGPGGVILTGVPEIASLAVGFASIKRVGEQKMASCKAADLFARTVRPTMASPCAMSCHGGANSVATNTFDMRSASSQDPMSQLRFCVDTMARIDEKDITKSVLLRQVTPAAMGGSQNHPYKLPDPGPFRQAVTDWAKAELMP